MNLRTTCIIVGLLAAAALTASLLLVGPRMKEQPHLLPFQDTTCFAPEGSVPVEGADLRPDSDSTRQGSTTPADVAAGKVYYGYYCVCCHGERGDGNGPVGESYVPRPADLRSGALRRFTDSAFMAAMLTGSGHSLEGNGPPKAVLARIVPPRDIGAIVRYVRSLGSEPSRP